MKLTIESTPDVVTLDGVGYRVWAGVTMSGTKCFVFVHGIAVDDQVDTTEFDDDLFEREPPDGVALLDAAHRVDDLADNCARLNLEDLGLIASYARQLVARNAEKARTEASLWERYRKAGRPYTPPTKGGRRG